MKMFLIFRRPSGAYGFFDFRSWGWKPQAMFLGPFRAKLKNPKLRSKTSPKQRRMRKNNLSLMGRILRSPLL